VDFLQSEDILCTDSIRAPNVVVVVLTIPSAILGAQVVHIIKFLFLEHPFELPVTGNVNADMIAPFTMLDVARRYLMSSRSQFVRKVCTYETCPAGD
jgi:hypothetical protein